MKKLKDIKEKSLKLLSKSFNINPPEVYSETTSLLKDIINFEVLPIEMILTCPLCNKRHIDDGEFSTKSHHTHACQHCGMVWRPSIHPTIGVNFLPGFNNAEKVIIQINQQSIPTNTYILKLVNPPNIQK